MVCNVCTVWPSVHGERVDCRHQSLELAGIVAPHLLQIEETLLVLSDKCHISLIDVPSAIPGDQVISLKVRRIGRLIGERREITVRLSRRGGERGQAIQSARFQTGSYVNVKRHTSSVRTGPSDVFCIRSLDCGLLRLGAEQSVEGEGHALGPGVGDKVLKPLHQASINVANVLPSAGHKDEHGSEHVHLPISELIAEVPTVSQRSTLTTSKLLDTEEFSTS